MSHLTLTSLDGSELTVDELLVESLASDLHGDLLRSGDPAYDNARIRLDGDQFRIGAAFGGLPVALRSTGEEGRWEVLFCHQKIREIDQREPVG